MVTHVHAIAITTLKSFLKNFRDMYQCKMASAIWMPNVGVNAQRSPTATDRAVFSGGWRDRIIGITSRSRSRRSRRRPGDRRVLAFTVPNRQNPITQQPYDAADLSHSISPIARFEKALRKSASEADGKQNDTYGRDQKYDKLHQIYRQYFHDAFPCSRRTSCPTNGAKI